MHIAFEDTCRRNKPYESYESILVKCLGRIPAVPHLLAIKVHELFLQLTLFALPQLCFELGQLGISGAQLGFRLREFAELLGHLSPGKLHALLWEELKSNLTFVGLKWIEASNLSFNLCQKNICQPCGFMWIHLTILALRIPMDAKGIIWPNDKPPRCERSFHPLHPELQFFPEKQSCSLGFSAQRTFAAELRTFAD